MRLTEIRDPPMTGQEFIEAAGLLEEVHKTGCTCYLKPEGDGQYRVIVLYSTGLALQFYRAVAVLTESHGNLLKLARFLWHRHQLEVVDA